MIAYCGRLEADARRARLRRRRRGGEGRLARAAAAARLDHPSSRAGPWPSSSRPGRPRRSSQAIEVQVGKTGTLTPVAKLQPVELAGVTIRNVSLHNEDEVRAQGRPRRRHRARSSAPATSSRTSCRSSRRKRPRRAAPFVFPDRCPACGRAAVRPRGRGLLALPQQRVPGPAQGAAAALRLAPGHGHRASRRSGHRPARRAPARDGLRRPLHADGGRGGRAATAWPRSPPRISSAAIRASKARGLARLLNALSIPHGGRARRRRSWPATSGAWSVFSSRARPTLAGSRARHRGRRSRSRSATFFDDETNRDVLRRLARPASR